MASAVRHHYMLGATAVVLAVAAAGGLGYFDEPTVERRPSSAVGQRVAQTAAFVPAPAPITPFEFNVFLVGTPEQQAALQSVEKQFRSPLPGGQASEVLLVRTVEEELYAAHHVEEVRMTYPGANVIVTDLRVPGD